MILDTIINGDCMEVLPTLPDKSVDLFLCDLPYGVTACHWDNVIDLNALFEQFLRLARTDKTAMVFTCQPPFSFKLYNAAPKLFRYPWYWNKKRLTNFANAHYEPMRCIEQCLVFAKKRPEYYPKGVVECPPGTYETHVVTPSCCAYIKEAEAFPSKEIPPVYAHKGSGLYTKYEQRKTGFSGHYLDIYEKTKGNTNPTQKPVEPFQHFIEVYTKEGATVLDPTAGSCTTAIACVNTNRKYICIEKDSKQFEKARERIRKYTLLELESA